MIVQTNQTTSAEAFPPVFLKLVELFAGMAHITQAFLQCGQAVAAVDINWDQKLCDLSTAAGFASQP